jgi:phospholipid-binding lipoprotein MlaA
MMQRRRLGHLRRIAGAIALALLTAACASEPESDDSAAMLGYEPPNDPIEPVNRQIFAFNQAADRYVLKPAAQAYEEVPKQVRDIIRNFIRHVASPVVLANDLLQGNLDRAGDTAARMYINTFTLGLGDMASPRYPYHSEDFGQTLGTYGAGEQFYLVLPLLGPSSGRDALGLVADIFLNPLFYVDATAATAYNASSTGVEGIDLRTRNLGTIEELKRDSVDFYARMRSLYLQRREAQINNNTEGLPAGPGFAGDDTDGNTAAPAKSEAAGSGGLGLGPTDGSTDQAASTEKP